MFSHKPFIIAEVANSHEGDIDKAKKLTEFVSRTKADAIKFQKFFAAEEAEAGHENYSILKKLEFTENEWKELIRFAKNKKLKVFFDVSGLDSVKSVSKFDIDGYKIHTSDTSNPLLLKFLSNTKKPILLSSAGTFPNEIDEALKILLKTSKKIVIMHGYQGYPTSLTDLNLLRIPELKRKYGLPVGISDHISGDSKMAKIIPVVGYALGASVIEKHITLDRSKKGIDHYSALNPGEFKEMVSLIHSAFKSMGNSNLILSKDEIEYRLKHKKNTIAKNRIKKETKLHDKLFEFKTTRIKKSSVPFFDYKNRTAHTNISKGKIVIHSMLNPNEKKVIAIIACRVGSERLFAKPLQLIGNYTILGFLINQIKTSKLVRDIVLAISKNTGNEVFVEFAKKNNLKYVLGDDVDVLKRLIDGARYTNADVILRVTSENPYINWEAIDDTIKNHLKGKYDYSTILPLPLGSNFELINLNALEISHKLGKKRHRSEHCNLYILENKDKFKIKIIKPEKVFQRLDVRLTVDTPQDLIVARAIHQALGDGKKPIKLKKIIKFLDDNPTLSQSNFYPRIIRNYKKMINSLLS